MAARDEERLRCLGIVAGLWVEATEPALRAQLEEVMIALRPERGATPAALTLREKMMLVLADGPLAFDALAERIGANPDSVARVARRYRDHFRLVFDDGPAKLERTPLH